MGLSKFFGDFTLAKYGRNIKSTPRELVFNKQLIFTAMLYATSAVPLSMCSTSKLQYCKALWINYRIAWDQGSASVITSLPAFQRHFGIEEATNAGQVRNFLTFVYLGDAIGAGLSFFLNDLVGRLWSFRIYISIWGIGQLVAILAPNVGALYAARIICGCGIGALTVTGPMSLAEIAPAEIRGLLTSWFAIVMGLAHFVSAFCVLGVYKNMEDSILQFQVIWFAPMIYLGLAVIASFFLYESPRWLFMAGERAKAVDTLVKLRGLPEDHPRVQQEITHIETDIGSQAELDMSPKSWTGMCNQAKQTFTVKSNVRRLTQAMILYALPQLSGGNSVGSYFVPILQAIGIAGDRERNMFLTGMYTMTKFFYAIIVSFFFIDLLGRRMSLFVGTTIQIITNIYVAAYTKIQKEHDGHGAPGPAQGAMAAVFVHAFGYSVGRSTPNSSFKCPELIFRRFANSPLCFWW